MDAMRIGTERPKGLTVKLSLSEHALRLIALGAIVAMAAALRFSDLSALGYVNHYYAAAVKSMLQSWHNFFFVAAEPGASVSVDKPPLGLWLQATSAAIFGVNTLGLLLPQLVAGLLSIVVLYHLVQRSFGVAAGLLAALALAITPVVVATDRNNTIDSTLILTLLLAAWAFIKASESGQLRFLLLGSLLVGIGFNIKMLQAYLPLPAFLALYFLGSKERLLPKTGQLVLAIALLLVVSLSWATLVNLTPADQRPYVGSSGDNSEFSLIAGYNGLERLMGMQRRGVGGSQRNEDAGLGQPPGAGRLPPPQPWNGGSRGGFGIGDGGGFVGPGRFPRGSGGGFGGTGRAGALRLITPPLSKEVSWLLPFGLFSALLVVLRTHLRWPVAARHQAVVLWGGWLLTGGVFFSLAGFFHEYYLSMLAAPLAALVGIGVAELWALYRERWWLGLGLLLVAAGGTLVLQVSTARAFVDSLPWVPLFAGLLAAGAVVLLLARLRWQPIARAGFACVVAAMLVTPGIWSGLTTFNASGNQSLPAAYDGRSQGPASSGGLQVNQALLDYLQANTQGTKYLMAVPSSMQGADYVLATGRPVLYLGGFMGVDQVETSGSLARLVTDGDLRYIYWDGQGRGFGAQPDISSWVTSTCTPVQGFDTNTQNSGAPDGTSTQSRGAFGQRAGNMRVTLYDCGGQ